MAEVEYDNSEDNVSGPRVPTLAGLDRGVAAAKKVLVVDDDPETVNGLAAILKEDGYQVDVVGSAEEALERFGVTTYHLLLTDLLLPGKSGVELTKTVHESAPATAIVLITGHATVKTAVSARLLVLIPGQGREKPAVPALRGAASDSIRKPVNPKKLRERVRTLLET